MSSGDAPQSIHADVVQQIICSVSGLIEGESTQS